MKLTLDICNPSNGKAFQPGDNVNGRVELQLADGLEAPDIKIVFQGTAKISLKPGYDAISEVSETHKQQTNKLFNISKTLSPTLAHRADTTPLQTFSAAFAFVFPHHAHCCSGNTDPAKQSCSLPPSTRISSARLKATVAYTITAVCRRPRGRSNRFNLLSYVQRSLTACRPLSFVPPADDQLYAPHVVPISATSVAITPGALVSAHAAAAPATAFVRPNAPLAGSQALSIPRQRSFQHLPAAQSATTSRNPTPRPSRAGSVSSHHQHDTVSDMLSLFDSPPLYSPANTHNVSDCPKLLRSTAWLPATKLSIDACPSSSPAKPTRQSSQNSTGDSAPPPGCLPEYTPAMTLEAVLPNPPILTPGQPIPLSLFVITPRPLLASADIVLRSMTVRLRRSTLAKIGTSTRVDDALWLLWSFKGMAPMHQERTDATAMPLWDKMQSVPGTIFPGFGSCFVSRTYSLEVTMGVSTEAAPSMVETATTSIRVMVSEPPPAYANE